MPKDTKDTKESAAPAEASAASTQKENKPAPQRGNTYRFMANILRDSSRYTKYVKALERVTGDPNIPFSRLIIACAVGFIAVLGTVAFVFSNTSRTPFVALPAVFLIIAILILTLFGLISSRDKSMLAGIMTMMTFTVVERLRLRRSENAALKSIGIRSIDRFGLITFSSGDVGALYLIIGSMSFSMLPAVAEAIINRRFQWFIARTPTSQETLITSVENVDVHTQCDALRRIMDTTATSDDLGDVWRYEMARNLHRYIKEGIGESETMVSQYIILRDVNTRQLRKCLQAFERAVGDGMLERAILITDADRIIHYLSGLAMIADPLKEAA